jgi:hypothetical protein
MEYKDLLQSVGIETFVFYYDVFKANKYEHLNEQIKEAFKHENWTENSANTKASCGKKIFEIDKEADVLLYIIKESTRIDKSVKKQAIKLLITDILEFL